jgi:hypothetical protein
MPTDYTWQEGLDELTYADEDEEPLDTETMVGEDWVYADLQLAQGTEEMLCKQVPLEAPILLEEMNQGGENLPTMEFIRNNGVSS